MKIIKEGNPDVIRRRIRFTCKRCGCIFDADFGEYYIDSWRNEEHYRCECPCCHASVGF